VRSVLGPRPDRRTGIQVRSTRQRRSPPPFAFPNNASIRTLLRKRWFVEMLYTMQLGARTWAAKSARVQDCHETVVAACLEVH
jgi:hypothetical protein